DVLPPGRELDIRGVVAHLARPSRLGPELRALRQRLADEFLHLILIAARRIERPRQQLHHRLARLRRYRAAANDPEHEGRDRVRRRAIAVLTVGAEELHLAAVGTEAPRLR